MFLTLFLAHIRKRHYLCSVKRLFERSEKRFIGFNNMYKTPILLMFSEVCLIKHKRVRKKRKGKRLWTLFL